MHQNQQEIDLLLQKNRQMTQRLIKNSKRWVQQYDLLLGGLKDAGDLSNWSKVIDNELKNVNMAI